MMAIKYMVEGKEADCMVLEIPEIQSLLVAIRTAKSVECEDMNQLVHNDLDRIATALAEQLVLLNCIEALS